MYNRLKSFFNKHDNYILPETVEYDFRDHRSTEHAILDVVYKIQETIDKEKFSCDLLISKNRSTLSIIISSCRVTAWNK